MGALQDRKVERKSNTNNTEAELSNQICTTLSKAEKISKYPKGCIPWAGPHEISCTAPKKLLYS